MPARRYRTFAVKPHLDEALRKQSLASGISMSRSINEALDTYLDLDQQNLDRVRKLAGALSVRPSRVIDNLIRDRLAELEVRRKNNDPAAILLGEIERLGV